MSKPPITKRYIREQATSARAYLRMLNAELAKPEPSWKYLAELADLASGHAGQIATDIEEATQTGAWTPVEVS